MKHTSFLSLCLAFTAMLLAPDGTASGSSVTLVQDNATGESWATGADWSDGLPATAGNQYNVGNSTGKVLRTPPSGTPSFPGTSLTLHATGRLNLKTSLSTVNGLRLNGGTLSNANNATQTINGTITVLTPSTIDGGATSTDSRDLNIGAVISGTGDLTVTAYSTGNVIKLNGSGSGYTGNWTIKSCFLDGVAGDSLGSGTITVLAGARFDADYAINHPNAGLVLNGVMDLDQNHTFKTVIINGASLAAGTYSFAALNASYDANFTDGGTGQLTVIGAAPGASYYMTLSGAGTMDGSNWANAFPASVESAVLNTTVQPGDTLYLEGANYGPVTLHLSSSGTSTAPKTIVGVDRGNGLPILYGPGRYTSSSGNTSVYIGTGASYWTIKYLKVQNRGWGMKATGGNVGIIIDGCEAWSNVNGFGFEDCDNMLIQNCKSERYTKFGFQWVHSCNGVTVKNCYADATGTGDTVDTAWRSVFNGAGFKMDRGSNGEPDNTDILFEDCESRNNNQDTSISGDYEQGDGWLVEFANERLTWRRCISYDNQQGAWDAKGLEQVLEDCVAVRSGNGFKIWKNATLTNCVSAECAKAVVVIGNSVGAYLVLTANYCTFHVGANSSAVPIWVESGEPGVTEAILNNCVVSYADARSAHTFNGYVAGGTSYATGSVNFNIGTANESFKHDNTGNTVNAPRYVNPNIVPWKPWLSNANAYDNITYGMTKGYNSTR